MPQGLARCRSESRLPYVTLCDRRWQLVLDCLGAEEPPFSEETLVSFRAWLIERTVELAAAVLGPFPISGKDPAVPRVLSASEPPAQN